MENSPSIHAAGSLAWPGDHELLAKYGVSIKNDIGPALIEIVTETNKQNQERIDESKNSGLCVGLKRTCKVLDKYEVTAVYKFGKTEKIPCAYCEEEWEHSNTYTIQNMKTGEAFTMPDVMLHLINEHDDLGDPGPYRITPTMGCRVLELGDTTLAEDDPLFQYVKYDKFDEDQLAQKKMDDKTLAQLEISPNRISSRINELIKIADENSDSTTICGDLKVVWARFLGYQHCMLCEPKKELGGYGEGCIENLKTGSSIPISTLVVHTIDHHGYFAKRDGYRIDPALAVEVLELKPNQQ